MAAGSLLGVIHRISDILGRKAVAQLADVELLQRFVREQDDAALAVLVKRHAPTVWGVCRRTLNHAEDAEDAFQATFLVFVRKARTIRDGELIGSWLYSVASRVAVRAKIHADRRRRCQQD